MEPNGELSNNPITPIKPKRGRRSKKDIELANAAAALKSANNSNNNNLFLSTTDVSIPFENNENQIKSVLDSLETSECENVVVKPPHKKRGRKPKGGKIIQQNLHAQPKKEEKPNIILHLKCSMKDLSENSDFHMKNNTIESFTFGKNDLAYEVIESCYETPNSITINNKNNFQQVYSIESELLPNNTDNTTSIASLNKKYASGVVHDNCETKEIWRKLKLLEQNLHVNNISDKKSACFWCSHDFDNPSIYIPKHYIKDTYHVYGCFCTPECGVAHLMNENIDSSTKFERYHLMNHIYSKIYDYTKNIKPAPNPHYMLDKFYGNLTIQEYRALLKSERLFLIVDKPLTRILPEFHEDNDEFIINNKIIPSNNYQIKKKTTQSFSSQSVVNKKTVQKSVMLNENFGLLNE
jgi:hypothetical protein